MDGPTKSLLQTFSARAVESCDALEAVYYTKTQLADVPRRSPSNDAKGKKSLNVGSSIQLAIRFIPHGPLTPC